MSEASRYNPNAERRKKRAEEKNGLSISHWGGDFHAHTRTDLTVATTPEAVNRTRRGSNCGQIPLSLLAGYHAREMKNEFLAITDHSRDGDPKAALEGVTSWFENLYLRNDPWLQEHYGKSRGELASEELGEIKDMAREQAKGLAFYEDERLEDVLLEISEISGALPMRVFGGVEVNLLPDGSFDTPMVEGGRFEVVNVSIHPRVDPEGFESVVNDPEKYTDLLILGIQKPKTNIVCHPGFDCGISPGESLSKAERKERSREFIEDLEWKRIAEAAIANNVAIEVNVKEVMDCIYQEMLNYDRFPGDSTEYREYFRRRLNEIVPILGSEKIGEALNPYFEKGLRIAINTDEHGNPYIDKTVTEESVEGSFRERDIRFWRCLKIAEGFFNEAFDRFGIKRENIINTYSVQELEDFLGKKGEEN